VGGRDIEKVLPQCVGPKGRDSYIHMLRRGKVSIGGEKSPILFRQKCSVKEVKGERIVVSVIKDTGLRKWKSPFKLQRPET